MDPKIIPINGIKNYIRCPMLYVFKNILGLNNERNIALKSQEVGHLALFNSYYRVLDGSTITWSELSKKIGSLIYQHSEDFDILEDEQQQINFNVHKGLKKYHARDAKLQYNILLLKKQVVLTAPVSVQTQIDLVREIQLPNSTYIRMDIFPDELISTNLFKTKHDLYHVSQVYAFVQMFNRIPDEIIVHNVTSPRQFELKFSPNELRRFERTIKFAAQHIREEAFYAAHSIDCQFCSYQTMCNKYKF